MRLFRVFASIALLSAAAGAFSQPHTYRNREFGIYLPIPRGTLACIPPVYEGNGVDHGPQILLWPIDANFCSKYSGKRYMDVVGAAMVDDWKTLHSHLESLCEYEVKHECSAAPGGLEINGLETEAGRLDRPDGSIEIIVVTAAGTPDPDYDPTVPLFNYSLDLNTDAQHFKEDLKVFRTVLQTIRIAPPEIRRAGQAATH
jgi:hypothetical protein